MENESTERPHSFHNDLIFAVIMTLAGLVGISCVILAGKVGMMIARYGFGLFSVLLLGLGIVTALFIVFASIIYIKKKGI